MKVNMKNDDGTVFEIAGDFQNLEATYKKADGDIIMEFSGTFEEFEKFQKMTQQPEEVKPKAEESGEDIHSTVEENSSTKPIHKFKVGDYLRIDDDSENYEYSVGEYVKIISINYNNQYINVVGGGRDSQHFEPHEVTKLKPEELEELWIIDTDSTVYKVLRDASVVQENGVLVAVDSTGEFKDFRGTDHTLLKLNGSQKNRFEFSKQQGIKYSSSKRFFERFDFKEKDTNEPLRMTQDDNSDMPKFTDSDEHSRYISLSDVYIYQKSEDELEVGKYFIVNKDGARLSQFDDGEIVTIVNNEGRFIQLENSLGVVQILEPTHLDSVTTLYGQSVTPEEAQEKIEQYFNLAKDIGISLNKTKGFQDQELYHPDFGKVVGYDNDLYLLWFRKEDNELDFDEAKEFSKFIKKDKFIPEEETLYYLKESVTDDCGDTVTPGLVTFSCGNIFNECVILQHDKPIVFAPDDIGDKVFKVRRRDIVKVIAETGTNNNVVGEIGLLLYEEHGFKKLVQEKPILRPYVAQDEIRQSSDEEAQNFFEKQIELSEI